MFEERKEKTSLSLLRRRSFDYRSEFDVFSTVFNKISGS